MTDSFALFGFPRRPALDGDALKQAYFRLAAALHPDASHGDAEQFAILQESLKTLAEPARRLRHLGALQFPGTVAAPGRMGSGDLFLKVGGVLQQAKAVMEKRDAAKTSLARAVLAKDIAVTIRSLEEVIALVRAEESALYERLILLDSRWPEVSAGELEDLASAFTYAARWRAQLSEWEFRLAQG